MAATRMLPRRRPAARSGACPATAPRVSVDRATCTTRSLRRDRPPGSSTPARSPALYAPLACRCRSGVRRTRRSCRASPAWMAFRPINPLPYGGGTTTSLYRLSLASSRMSGSVRSVNATRRAGRTVIVVDVIDDPSGGGPHAVIDLVSQLLLDDVVDRATEHGHEGGHHHHEPCGEAKASAGEQSLQSGWRNAYPSPRTVRIGSRWSPAALSFRRT